MFVSKRPVEPAIPTRMHMEKVGINVWRQPAHGVSSMKPKIISKRISPDLMCHTVYISTFLDVIYETDFITGNNIHWKMKIFGNGISQSNTRKISFGLCLTHFPRNYPIDVLGSIFTNEGITFFQSFSPTEVWGLDGLTFSGGQFKTEINIMEKLHINEEKKISSESTDSELNSSNELSHLVDYTDLLFRNDRDFVLCGDDWEFSCHKLVLSNRSSVFRAMLNHDTIETRTNRVKISDIEGAVMRSMLIYLYTFQPLGMDKFPVQLLGAAHKYQLDDLKDKCIDFMLRNITNENAAEYLQVSDTYDIKTLRQTVLRFINMNLISILPTDGWKKLEALNPTLCDAIKELGLEIS